MSETDWFVMLRLSSDIFSLLIELNYSGGDFYNLFLANHFLVMKPSIVQELFQDFGFNLKLTHKSHANFWHGKFQLQDFAQNYTTRNLSFFQSNLVSSSDSQTFPDKMTQNMMFFIHFMQLKPWFYALTALFCTVFTSDHVDSMEEGLFSNVSH